MTKNRWTNLGPRLVHLIHDGAFANSSSWAALATVLSHDEIDVDESNSIASEIGDAYAMRQSSVADVVRAFGELRTLAHKLILHLIPDGPMAQEKSLASFDRRLDTALAQALGAYLDYRLAEAHRDTVTKLPDRTAFETALKEEVERASRYQRRFSLIIFDIDEFKMINDSQGHPEGDRVLFEVGVILRRMLRRTDRVFRYGGDEFAAICLELDAGSIARVLTRVENGLNNIKISSGVAYFPDEAVDGVSLVTLADRRLYDCKRKHHAADTAT